MLFLFTRTMPSDAWVPSNEALQEILPEPLFSAAKELTSFSFDQTLDPDKKKKSSVHYPL